jgi:hypothetical protein
MRRAALFLIALLFFPVLSCSPVAEVRHTGGLEGTTGSEVCCRKECLPYIETPHRLIHAIEARLPDGTATALLGVVLVDLPGNVLHCVLMTPEGFVLLDAVDHQGTEIRRSVPPFDSAAVSMGLLADIRLLFFPPSGALRDAGWLKNGTAICRFFSNIQGTRTDVIATGTGCWEIRQYDGSDVLQRSIRLSGALRRGLFEKIELEAPGLLGYSLKMTLLEAEPAQ